MAQKGKQKGDKPDQVMRVRTGGTDDNPFFTTIAVGWSIEVGGKPGVSWKFQTTPIGWDGSALQMVAKEDA